MSTNSTGQGSNASQHTLDELIAGGVTLHPVDTAMDYGDGATEISNKSILSTNIAEADLTAAAASGFDGSSTITNDSDIVIDVSGETATAVEVVLQNQSNTDRWALADETNDPDLSQIDTYRIDANTTLYSLGNP